MVSADSIVPDPANPQAWNRYSYVLNNPVNLTDPSGHRPCELYCPDESINWREAQQGSAYGGVYDVEQQRINSEKADVWIPGAVETIVGIAWEPADWAIALSDGIQWYDGIGMLPLIPAALGDNIGKAVARNIPTGAVDDVVDGLRRAMGLCSFSAETLVMTEHGAVDISEVELYDKVLAYNEETGEIDYYPVIAVWEHIDPVIVTLTIDGEVIETTPEHPFYTIDGKWLAAGQLRAGDEIRTADWNTGTIEAIGYTIDPQPMYNFTVDTAHTYFVGDGQWLVHNDCFTPNGRKLTEHAQDQALNRNINMGRIDDVIDNFSRQYEQADGSMAYIKKTGRNRYDIVIEGDEGIATVMSNKSRHELRNLAQNYGWQGFDW